MRMFGGTASTHLRCEPKLVDAGVSRTSRRDYRAISLESLDQNVHGHIVSTCNNGMDLGCSLSVMVTAVLHPPDPSHCLICCVIRESSCP